MAVDKDFPEKMLALRDEACERAVLGALILESGVYYKIADYLREGVFTSTKYQFIFSAIKQMKDSGQDLDLVTLTTFLQKNPSKSVKVESYEIVDIVSEVASTVTAESNAANLFDLWQRRQLLLAMYGAAESATDRTTDITAAIEKATESIKSVADFPMSQQSTASDALQELNQMLLDQLEGKSVGTHTGFVCIDERGGLKPTALTIIGAYSGQGKSSIALQIAIHAASEGDPVAYYTLEMGKAELMGRAVAAEANINVSSLLNNPKQLSSDDWKRYSDAKKKLSVLPIFFDEKATNSVEGIISSARMFVRRHGIKGIFVDYLQILTTNRREKTDKEEFLGNTVRAFKNLAKEENIFVILLSQLARNHDSKEPNPDYLRGSGQILEGCDNCYLIYRPEATGGSYSGFNSNVDTKGTAQIQVCKCRNGAAWNKYIVGFAPEYTKFYELNGKVPQKYINGIDNASTKANEIEPEPEIDVPF